MRRFIVPIIIGVVVVGGIWLLSSLADDVPSRYERASVYNTDVDGVAAMYQWLDELGYDVRALEYVEWEFNEQQSAVLVLSPSSFFQAGEPDTILQWVRDTGGTLIVVDDQNNALYRELDLELSEDTVAVAQQTNLPLGNPAARSLNLTQPTPFFTTSRRDVAVLAGSETQPVLVAIAEGRGIVYALSSFAAISNGGLRDEANARVMQNLLGRVPEGGTILFDEIHHGRALPPKVPRRQVVFSPLVAAVVYSTLIIGLWAMLTGRRFGTIVPSRAEVSRRSSAEYVQSMAGLFQRGRQTGHILAHYKTAFKRRVAKPYGFNPRLGDEDYVRELHRFTPIEEGRLLQLLTALSNPNPSEEGLLRLVNAADAYALELEQQR